MLAPLRLARTGGPASL